MTVMIFIVGALLGLLVGAAIYVRNIRQEVPARLAFSMHLMETRLTTLQASVDQVLSMRHHEEVQRRDRVLD